MTVTRYRHPGLLLLGLAALGCADQPSPTDPAPPATDIRDGAHGGNAHFFFLPPLVPEPRVTGAVDPSLLPFLIVQVCDLGMSRPPATTSCGAEPVVIARFTGAAGTGGQVLRYDSGVKHYLVNWRTDLTPLQISHYYRLQVLAGGTELGQADIDPVRNARDLRNYDSGDAIPLVDGRTLPIRFRVETGAVAILSPGATDQRLSAPSAVAGQPVVISVPGGTEVNGGTASLGLTVTPAPTLAGTGALAGTAYEFGPDGTSFSAPVTLTVPYDPAALGAVPAARLRLYRLAAPGRLELLDGSAVDLQAHTVSGRTDHFSVYVVAEQVGTVDIVQPSLALAIGQTAALDASIDQPGRVIAWATTDPAVATVADDGTVTAVGAGVAGISATSEGQADQVSVTVASPLVADFGLSVTTLGVLPDGYIADHVGINPRHTVVLGNAHRPTGQTDDDGNELDEYRLFVYTAGGGLRWLEGVYASGDLSDANGERASGFVQDAPGGDYRQVVWDLATNAVLYSAPGFGGAINDDNFVVGVCGEPELCGDNPTIRDATGSLVHTLPHGPSYPASVSRLGEHLEVVGTEVSGSPYAFLWTPAAPALRNLTPGLTSAAGIGINLSGQVTGHFHDAATGRQGAFVWSETDGLELLPNPFGTVVAPGTITDDGEVFGQTAFPDDPLRRIIVWAKEGGEWVAKVSEEIPAGRAIGNTNNLGETPAVNVATGEIELLTLVR